MRAKDATNNTSVLAQVTVGQIGKEARGTSFCTYLTGSGKNTSAGGICEEPERV
jgi:hypothetical protein